VNKNVSLFIRYVLLHVFMSYLQSERKYYLLITIMSFKLDLDCSLLSHNFEICCCIVTEFDFANDFHSFKLCLKLIFWMSQLSKCFWKMLAIFSHNGSFYYNLCKACFFY